MTESKSEGLDQEDASPTLGLSTASSQAPVTIAPRVLPADVYDTLELTALVFGGIGAGEVTEKDRVTPFCILGHMNWAEADDMAMPLYCPFGNAVAPEMVSKANNRAVRAINERKGAPNIDARVSWDEYTSELNIVRGA